MLLFFRGREGRGQREGRRWAQSTESGHSDENDSSHRTDHGASGGRSGRGRDHNHHDRSRDRSHRDRTLRHDGEESSRGVLLCVRRETKNAERCLVERKQRHSMMGGREAGRQAHTKQEKKRKTKRRKEKKRERD